MPVQRGHASILRAFIPDRCIYFPSGCNQRKEVIQDYLKIGDFTLFHGDAEMYFKTKSEKREFHNWRDIRVNVYV